MVDMDFNRPCSRKNVQEKSLRAGQKAVTVFKNKPIKNRVLVYVHRSRSHFCWL